MSLAAIPWLENDWQRFLTNKKAGRVAHAMLLSGSRGLGKKQFSKAMTRTLLCSQPKDDGEACGNCHSCQLFAAGSHPDLTLIEPEEVGKAIKVDQIRDLIARQSLMTKVSAWKVVVIQPADSMNINAFNSLLKLLEEPQSNTALILLADNLHQLPITIRSRCQNIVMTMPTTEQAINWLQQQQPDTPVEAWPPLLKLASGAPLQALSLSTQQIDLSTLRVDFDALLTGQANPVILSEKWQQFDLLMLFHALQQQFAEQIQILLLENSDASPRKLKRLWSISDCIIDTIKLISASNNLNKTLLIEDFMVSVMHYANGGNSSRANR